MDHGRLQGWVLIESSCSLLDNFGDGPFTHRITVALRLTFVGAIALLGAGGGIGGVDDAGLRHTGHILTLVGYVVFAAELAVLTAMQVYYFTRKSSLVPSGHKVRQYPRMPFQKSPSLVGDDEEKKHQEENLTSLQVLRGTLLAAPFIAVRTVYGILEVATSNDPISKWNPVTGSTVTFAFMALVMEYIALCIYLFTGYSIPPGRDLPARSSDTEAGKLTSTNN